MNENVLEKTTPPVENQPIRIEELTTEIPQRFFKVGGLAVEELRTDRLTGLLVQTDEERLFLIRRLTQSIKGDGRWVCINADLDQLKRVNEKYGRRSGDKYIQWGASIITQGIDRILSQDIEAIAVRRSHAADETLVWIFGLSGEEIEKVRQFQSAIPEQPVAIDDSQFNFSISTGMITSDDQSIRGKIEETKTRLMSEPDAKAFNFFQEVEEMVDNAAKAEKTTKELLNLPLEGLLEHKSLQSLIDAMKNNFGGGRISEEMLDLILKLQSIQTITLLKHSQSREAYMTFLKELGVGEEELSKMKTAEDLVRIFQGMFGRQTE